MKKNLLKKIVAYVCAIAMVIGTFTGIGTVTAKAADDIFVDGAVHDYGTTDGYAYNYGWLCGADSAYKYLIITYTGDITNLRIGFVKGTDRDNNIYWMDQTKETEELEGKINQSAVLVGEPILTSETGATVVLDLEACGINLDNFDAMDMHYGPGTLNIGYVRLSESPEITDVDVMPGKDDAEVAKEPMSLDGLIATWAPEGEGYAYLTEVEVGKAGYKYLQLTYKGDENAFNDLRVEFEGAGKTLGFVNPYDGQLVTVDGTAVPTPAAEEQTVVIDLEASGIDTSLQIAKIHLHQTAGNGAFEITNAQLLTKYGDEDETSGQPGIDPSTGIQLDDPASGMNGTYHIDQASVDAQDGIQWKYLGWVTFKDYATKDFKYLKLTYTGDITSLRFEFEGFPENGKPKTDPYWFSPEQELHFVTVDGSEIPMIGDNTTITIDLEKSGIDIGKYNSGIHMHGNSTTEAAFDVTIKDAVLFGGTPTPRETTTVANEQKTTAKTTASVKAPVRTKVKTATKKKAAKKVKLTLKKISGAKGYKVQFSKTKKFKKVLVTKIVKKASVTIKNKKLKNQKKLYVRAKAYKLNGKKKVYSKKWSVVKKVKIKK